MRNSLLVRIYFLVSWWCSYIYIYTFIGDTYSLELIYNIVLVSSSDTYFTCLLY